MAGENCESTLQQCGCILITCIQTRSQAVTDYKLALKDLVNIADDHIRNFAPTLGAPWPGAFVRPLEAWPSTGLKTLRHAVYLGPGVETTMFFKHEVEERAKVMRGDCLVGGHVNLSLQREVTNAGLKGTTANKRKANIIATDPNEARDHSC